MHIHDRISLQITILYVVQGLLVLITLLLLLTAIVEAIQGDSYEQDAIMILVNLGWLGIAQYLRHGLQRMRGY